jgi:prepilin-type N-terminal cleavage/methylation domain-containing protein
MRNRARCNRAQGFTLIEILVVITIIASLAGAVLILVPRIQEKQKQTTCANHLRQLGGVYTAESMEKPGLPPQVGASLWLYYRQKHFIQRGREEVLTCPGDQTVRLPANEEESLAYDDFNLADPPVTACSYMGRDFINYPMNAEAEAAQIIGCDRNTTDHRTPHYCDGVNILFDDGAVQMKDREYLGLTPDDPIVVGPESDVEILRQVIYGPPRKE